MDKGIKIAVIALLKPSQVKYKVTPILLSDMVSQVVLFRKKKYSESHDKLIQYVLPAVFKVKPVYWIATPYYIAWKLRQFGTDLLLTYGFVPHAMFTFIISKLLSIRYIYGQIDDNVIWLHKRQWGRPIVEKVLRNAYQINVPGSVSRHYWERYLSCKINLLHSTVDTDEYSPVAADIEFDFMYVGVLTKLKRVELLIEAIRVIVRKGFSLKLAVVGYGEQMPKLQELVTSYDLEEFVVFLGEQKVDKYLLSKARIFCFASISEGLPCALIEAMSCKLVCVTTPVGNIPDIIVPGETGFFFDEAEPQKMAQLMIYLSDNYNDLGDLRERARRMVILNHSNRSAERKWNNILRDYTNYNNCN